MDLSRIFLKNACPTRTGGQAIMEGVMMRGPDRIAVAQRLPDGRLHLRTQALKPPAPLAKIPVVRGIVNFVSSLTVGMKTLLYSADVLEAYGPGDDEREPSKFDRWLTSHFGKKAAWDFAVYAAVALAILLTVGIFILLPTVAVNLLGRAVKSDFLLNLIEGLLRLLLFTAYIAAISGMQDIRTIFEYHGSEHKTIHCFENGLALTPANAQGFCRLHPRCGTSFLMFVVVVSLVVFSLLGWPNIWLRIASRILLIPVVAGLSYELLQWAGRSDNVLIRVLSIPGLLLQKLTTREPSDRQLEVAIVSMKAVLVDPAAPLVEGICDSDGNLIEADEISKKEEGEA